LTLANSLRSVAFQHQRTSSTQKVFMATCVLMGS
jgi:hypothetical protein